MTKYNKQPVSSQTVEESLQIAKASQKPGQTKEQTKLIAQGIQKGISEYKKQQKAKARALDKQKKKGQREPPKSVEEESQITNHQKCHFQWLPWSLLILSWVIMAIYILKVN
ncbi:MAG: DUF2956 domain-containing protein [Gammaproteobacteria bacterium]|nr:DUF2956 domain-containing protein [Gammaproteobacteria bacterium]